MKYNHKILAYVSLALWAPVLAGAADPKPAPSAAPTAAGADLTPWMKSAKFIVGVYSVEDMLQIPGTRWIVGSGVNTQGPGMEDQVIRKNYLHLFDAETETGGRVEPEDIALKADKGCYPETTTPPNWETFGPHGIALGERKGNVITLYAINHGTREAVEIFKIKVAGKRPKFTWVGTILAPADGFIDALAWIPGTDGFVITSLLDPRDPHAAMEKQMKGEPNGWVKEWHPKTGWKTLPGTESFSTPNGIIISEDGRHVFVAASTGLRLYRVTRGGADPEVVSAKVAGFPDNLRWSADGKSILAPIHTEDVGTFVAAQMASVKIGGSMFTKFNVTRLDPEKMTTQIVMPSGLYGAFGACTNAIEVGHRLWLGSTKSDRVAIFDLPPATPSIK